jgi:hypothetical protein
MKPKAAAATTLAATLLLLASPAYSQQNRRPETADRHAPAQSTRGELAEVDVLRGWIDLIERYTELAKDPVAAGVAAVINANDLLKQKGADVAIEYFTKLLSEVKNESVQRAIRLQLVELYGKSGQTDDALEQLRLLMILAPKEPTKQP